MALHDPEEDKKRRARARARARRRRPTLPTQASDTARAAVAKRKPVRKVPPSAPAERKPAGLGGLTKTGGGREIPGRHPPNRKPVRELKQKPPAERRPIVHLHRRRKRTARSRR